MSKTWKAFDVSCFPIQTQQIFFFWSIIYPCWSFKICMFKTRKQTLTWKHFRIYFTCPQLADCLKTWLSTLGKYCHFGEAVISIHLFLQQMRNFSCLSDLKPVLAKMPVVRATKATGIYYCGSIYIEQWRDWGWGKLACNYPDVLKHTCEGIYRTKPLVFVIIIITFSDSILISNWYIPFEGFYIVTHIHLQIKMLYSLYIITIL